MTTPIRILLIKRDKIGDMLLTTPMLKWIREALPAAELHVLANDYNAWVVASNPDIDHLWIAPRVRHHGKLRLKAIYDAMLLRMRLRKERFDWVLVGNGEDSPRAIRLGLSVNGRYTVAYCDAPQQWTRLTHPQKPDPQEHESRRLARLAEPLGVEVPKTLPYPLYTPNPETLAGAARWIRSQGLVEHGYIVVGLGARKLRKKPSARQVLRWAERIHQQWGCKTVLLWTPGPPDDKLYPGDDDIAAPILEAGSPHIVPLSGELHEAIGVIWSARSSIIPDSGLMHFAAASPGGVVGLFANRSISPSPIQWGPFGARSSYVEADHDVPGLSDEVVFKHLCANLQSDGAALNIAD
jgi:heptosyltransferase-3